MNASSFYGFSSGPPIRHKVTRTYTRRTESPPSLTTTTTTTSKSSTKRTRQSNPWSALARAKQIKATKDTNDSATVEVIDLTVDEPCEVIDLTGDSDSDYFVNPAWAAPRFSFPFCKMTSDSLLIVLDSLRTGLPDENSAALDSLLGLFNNITPRTSRLHLRRSTTLANRSLNPTPSKPAQNESTEQLPKHDALKAYITANFNQSDAVTPLTEILNNPVTPDLLTTLVNPTSWLSDEAINAFTAALQIAYPRIKFFNTFFYSVLGSKRRKKEGYDYDSVRRWTKKQVRAGIFEFDRVVIPINKGNTHWCFAFISLRDQFHITFLDSLPGSTVFAKIVLQNLKRYLQDEWDHKVVAPQLRQNAPHIPSIESFELVDRVAGCPVQSDGSSCGVFVCYYAFCVARCEDVTSFTFSQTDAWLFRKAISYVLAYPLLTELNQLENESDNK